MPTTSYRHRTLFTLSALSLIASFSLNGCSSIHYNVKPEDIGKQADLNNPPKLISESGDPKDLAWDRPAAFGPVPDNLKAAGEKACKPIDKDDLYAAGYNPKAIGADDKPIPGGGFLCILKDNNRTK